MDYSKIAVGMAGYIASSDIDEDICKKVNCERDEDSAEIDCINCIMEWFNKDCIWLSDELKRVCTNYRSKYNKEIVGEYTCGRCEHKE